jgi:hypothetical protein
MIGVPAHLRPQGGLESALFPLILLIVVPSAKHVVLALVLKAPQAQEGPNVMHGAWASALLPGLQDVAAPTATC